MDLALYVRTLAEVGFQGGLALDLYKYDYEQVAGEAIQYIRDLVKRAARIGPQTLAPAVQVQE